MGKDSDVIVLSEWVGRLSPNPLLVPDMYWHTVYNCKWTR